MWDMLLAGATLAVVRESNQDPYVFRLLRILNELAHTTVLSCELFPNPAVFRRVLASSNISNICTILFG